ncbi:hypothetical protein JCM10212_006611 [Sporobolomyces blumeae]
MPSSKSSPSPLSNLASRIVKRSLVSLACVGKSKRPERFAVTFTPPLFLELPLDPFAGYTVPSRAGRRSRKSTPKPPASTSSSPSFSQISAFPAPPPRPARLELAPSIVHGEHSCAAWDIRKEKDSFKSKMIHAKLAVVSLECAQILDELDDEGFDYDRDPDASCDSDRESIFTLPEDEYELDTFERNLFFLRPVRARTPVEPSPSRTSLRSTSASPITLTPSSSASSGLFDLPSRRSDSFSSASSVSVYSCETSPSSSRPPSPPRRRIFRPV